METFAKLIEQYPSEVFKKGQTLLLKDDIPRAVYVIESGVVRAYSITHDGAERLVAIHAQGEDIPAGFGFGLVQESQYFTKHTPNAAYVLSHVRHLKNIYELILKRCISGMFVLRLS